MGEYAKPGMLWWVLPDGELKAEPLHCGEFTLDRVNALARLKNAPIVHDGMDGKGELAFHGLTARWRDAVGLYSSPACSNCGSGAAVKTRFCPHCGAKMENALGDGGN